MQVVVAVEVAGACTLERQIADNDVVALLQLQNTRLLNGGALVA